MFRRGWHMGVLIVLALVVFLWLIKATIMSIYISDKLGLHVIFRSISMWPRETTIRHFSIGNPHDFKRHAAFEVKKIHLDYRLGALIGPPSEIDQILLDHVYINIDISNVTGTQNNWAKIGAQLVRHKEKREVIIHKLLLRDITVDIHGKGAKLLGVSGRQTIDEMEFDEINSLEGFPTKELVSQIFEKAGIMKYLQDFLNPTQKIQNNLNPLNLFGQQQGVRIETDH